MKIVIICIFIISISQIFSINLKGDIKKTLGNSSLHRNENERKVVLIKRSRASRNIVIINTRKKGHLDVSKGDQRGNRQGILITRTGEGIGDNNTIQVSSKRGLIRQVGQEDYGKEIIGRTGLSDSRGTLSNQETINSIRNSNDSSTNRGSINQQNINIESNANDSNDTSGRGAENQIEVNNETDRINRNNRGTSPDDTNNTGDINDSDTSQENNLNNTRGSRGVIGRNATNNTENEEIDLNMTRGGIGNNTRGSLDDNNDSENDDEEEESSEENNQINGRGVADVNQNQNSRGSISANQENQTQDDGNQNSNIRGSSPKNNKQVVQSNDVNMRGSQINNNTTDNTETTMDENNLSQSNSNQRRGKKIHKN